MFLKPYLLLRTSLLYLFPDFFAFSCHSARRSETEPCIDGKCCESPRCAPKGNVDEYAVNEDSQDFVAV